MATRRLILVNTLLGLLLVGLALPTVLARDYWPFAYYNMFATLDRDFTATGNRLYGVTAADPPAEIPLIDAQSIEPFDNARLSDAFDVIEGRPDRDQRLQQALTSLLSRYEERRRAGLHSGPPLRGLRLYRLTWHGLSDTPDQRELLFEVNT